MKITLFYEQVTILDYAYLDDHKGPMGHSQIVDVEFTGQTDEEGIVYDFSYAKKTVKEIIDRECDHRFVVPEGVTQINKGQAHLKGVFGFEDIPYEYWCPVEGLCILPYAHVSDETLTTHLETLVMKEMPNTVKSVKLKLRNEKGRSKESFFHYTHGLKDHYGNCQRLIHGHRSTVEVYLNSKRDSEIESYLATDLFSSNIHFCYWENIVNKTEVSEWFQDSEKSLGRLTPGKKVEIKYTSSQGEFRGLIPSEIIYVMPMETTVENLSIHFAQLIKQDFAAGDQVMVRAFEGIGKGSKTTI